MVIRSLRRSHPLPAQRTRLLLLLGASIVWALAIVSRLFFLQVISSDDLASIAARQRTASAELPSRRGDIHDRKGRTLATSIDLESVYAHPPALAGLERATAELIATALNESTEKVEAQLRKTTNFVYLKRKALPSEAIEVRKIVRRAKLEHAIHTHTESGRYYPQRHLGAHVIGFVDVDNKGQAGIELQYDNIIRGESGHFYGLRDGRARVAYPTGGTEAADGQDLTLTLDSVLQFAAEEALARAVKEHRATGGSAVVLDPRTGAILAMASYPVFNPNLRDAAFLRNAVNRAIALSFEPGSVFKIITVAAALEEGLVSEEELIDCEGGMLQVAGHVYDDWRHGFGVIPFRQVIMHSSNVGTIKVAMRLEPQLFYRWALDFGFGSRTGVPLPGESPGHVIKPNRWGALEQPSMAIGQGIAVTTLQLAAAVASVANGGLLLEPYVVARTSAGYVAERKVTRRVLDELTARRTARILEAVVTSGTGAPASILGYRIGGKTATAQKIGDGGRYTEYIASFAGFFPVSDPRVVIIASVDEPTRGYGHQGSRAAAPLFREIAEAAIRVLRIPPDASMRPHVPTKPNDAARAVPVGGSPTTPAPE